MTTLIGQLRIGGLRGILAAVLAFVLLLQPSARTTVDRTALLDSESAFSLNCSANGIADHNRGREGVPCKEHCLLCVVQLASLPIRMIFVIALARVAEATTRFFPSAFDDAPPVPSGWRSAWSSQGPPSFS